MMIQDEQSNIDRERDSVITCMMCGTVFSLQEGEQDFYIQRGLDLPKRCPTCRAERKAQKAVGEGFRPPVQKQPTTSEVECHHCNRVTVVPFTPREGSSVYCRVCWEGIKNVGVTGAVYV
jgi:CxxC-x17-CxxC domain-containing protein